MDLPDLKLPKVEGLGLLRGLKANPHTGAISMFVLVSSQPKSGPVENCDLSANGFLAMRMELDEVGDSVRMLGRYWLKFNQDSNK